MKPRPAFTLTELLAVMGIMAILVAGTVTVVVALSGRIGPESASLTLQAMLNATRDHAAANGVKTRLVFQSDWARLEEGTRLTIEYQPPSSSTWTPVGGLKPVALGPNLIVLKNAPSDLTSITVPPPAATPPTDADISKWNTYRQNLLKALARHGFTTNATTGLIEKSIRAEQGTFYVQFEPAGYMSVEDTTQPNILTVVQLAGGRDMGLRVGEYMFFPINPNTGTRLVFD